VIRWLLWLLAGLLLGGIVHLGSVLLLPRTATQDAYTRLAPFITATRSFAVRLRDRAAALSQSDPD